MFRSTRYNLISYQCERIVMQSHVFDKLIGFENQKITTWQKIN